MRRIRHSTGSVLFDKGRGTWRFLQWVDGRRRSQTLGTKQKLPTKAAAWKAASTLVPKEPKQETGITVSSLVEVYRAERMPQRFSTRYSTEPPRAVDDQAYCYYFQPRQIPSVQSTHQACHWHLECMDKLAILSQKTTVRRAVLPGTPRLRIDKVAAESVVALVPTHPESR